MLNIGDLCISILTVPREPEYIHQTLASLFSSGPDIYRVKGIHLMVDTNDRSYLAEYHDCAFLNISYLSDAEFEQQRQRTPHLRFCTNYLRCLSVPADGGLLILEDDVLLRDRFLLCLKQAVDEMEDCHGLSSYVLSLHAKANLPQIQDYYRGHYYISYPTGMYYGTQGMYYPAAVRAAVADYIREQAVTPLRCPGDLLIKELVTEWQNLYNTVWDLVEHIGTVSTGLGGAPRSHTFKEKWRPLTFSWRKPCGCRGIPHEMDDNMLPPAGR